MPPNDETTRERVRSQYERFPYPTPRADLRPFVEGHALEVGFPRAFFHKYWPREPYREDLDILIAGCGSTQAAWYAAAHPRANVTAIDLSEKSLAHTRRLAEEYGLANLSLQRLEVERVGEVGGDFDLIVSTGVIHHLPNPARGLEALRGVLRPQGAMHVMVYAPYGRDAIYYLQSFMRDAGITVESVNEADIPELVRFVDTLPREHPLWHRRRQFPDLRNGPELVDYLLHPQDRAYTLAQCRDLLRECDLALQDVFNRAYYAPRCSALGKSPLVTRLGDRPEFERFDLGETYRAALIRHDLIVCRDERPESSRRVAPFEPAGRVVPVRMPGVQAAGDRPPAGKAAWLYWPAHAFADIRLALDREELAFFNAVDDQRTVDDILTDIDAPGLSSSAERVEELLEALVDFDLAWLRAG